MISESQNSSIEIKQRTDRDIRQSGILVSESYESESTDQQTVINLNMSVDINNHKQLWVFIDGTKLVEGATGDYIFTNVVSNVSAQVTLNAPIMAGLPIQVYKLGAYQESFPNASSVTATLLNDVAQPNKMALAGFQPFVQKTFITAPSTTIINRAQVEAASLKAIAGIERVMCRSIALNRTEFGSNGEPVWEVDSKDSRIRFVGAGWMSTADTNGSRLTTVSLTDYIEIIYYGTGLNLLSTILSASISAFISIDGASEIASNIFTGNSTILSGRNYAPNQVVSVVSSQALNWHTVKIRNNNAASLPVFGFEILNQRTDLAVLAGTAFGGTKQEILSALSASAFNAGVSGIRGARIVKYIQNGVISQAVQEVNGASAFLASSDHTNEDVAKKLNVRDFGANRVDDFSTLVAADATKAFTLDDGTTTLVCYYADYGTVATGYFSARAAVGYFWTLTFIGTGLDLAIATDSTTRASDVYVDGVYVATVSKTGSTTPETRKIVSGLAYGTHTIKFLQTTAAYGFGVSDFTIYQPKKPAIPSGAIEICDYNLVANKVINSNPLAISTGVLRKFGAREVNYVGTFIAPSLDTVNFVGGFNISTSTIGAYFEYSFFGTGIEHNTFFNGSAINHSYLIDGSSNLSGFTTSVTSVGIGTTTFVASTGVLSGTPIGGTSRISISGLTLGWHKIRVTYNSGNTFYSDAFDLITPIHINTTTLKVGSMSLRDSRCFSPIIDKPNVIDLTKAKAILCYDGTNSKMLNSFGITAVLNISAGVYVVYFEKPFKDTSYTCVGSSDGPQLSVYSSVSGPSYKTKSFQIVVVSGSTGSAGNGNFNLTFFGEQEDEGEI